MPTSEEIITKLLNEIDNSTNSFNDNIPALQQQIADDMDLLIKELETDRNGNLKNSIKNFKLLGKLKSKIENIVLNEDYLKNVDEYLGSFDKVAAIQNQYFKSIDKSFTPTEIIKEIQSQSIEATAQSLTEAGIQANIVEEMQSILRDAIVKGSSYKQISKDVNSFLTDTEESSGALTRYTKQITTDSLNQFAAQYNATISSDMDSNWYMYVGSTRKKTREFCDKLVEKKYIHKSELPTILKGNIDGSKVRINPKTDLWYGAIDGTNVNNFQINRGGYSCNHQLLPTKDFLVPKNLREKFNS
jgi:hypothetical protein